jgi:protein O-mannosyl-transferase
MKSQSIKQRKGQNIPKKTAHSTVKFDPYKWWKNKRALLTLAILLVVTFIVMQPSLKGKFLNWDDDVNIYDNNNVKHLTCDNIKNIFTGTVIGGYNPFTIFTFALEYKFFKEKTFYYHLDNIILHLLNAFFVFWWLMLLGLRKEWAFFAALFFSVHPMRVESVAWITERKDVLFAFFYLASVICYVYYLKYKKKRFYFLVLVFFLLSLFSKIQAVALPLTLLLIDYILKRPLKFRLILEKIPHLLFSLAIGLLGIYFLGKQESLDQIDYSFLERFLVGTYSLCVFLYKSIFPYPLSAVYAFPEPGYFPLIYYFTPFIIIGLGVLVYLAGRRSRIALFGSLFFLFNIIFILQVLSAGQGFCADRFSYIPYIGLAYVYASGGSWLMDKYKKWMPLIITIAAAIIIVNAVNCRNRIKVWENTETLFTDVLQQNTKVPLAYRNRGNYYRDNKIKDKGLADFSALIQLTPKEAKPYISRGKIYFDRKDTMNAFQDFNKAVLLDSTSAEAYSNRGSVYGLRQKYDLALKDFSKAIKLNPKWKDALLNRSLLLYSSAKFNQALSDLNNYLAMDPNNADACNMRGLCKAQLNDLKGAIDDYSNSIILNPNEPIFYQNRAFVYSMLGEKSKALNDLKKAQQLGAKIDLAVMEKLN